MKCFVCGKESPGEVCSSCLRDEQGFYNREYQFKEGLLVKKKEDLRIVITSARIYGSAVVSPYQNGMNAKVDNFNHWIGGVQETGISAYLGKPSPYVHVKVPGGMERYLIFPQFDDILGVKSAIDKAKENQVAAPATTPIFTATAPAPAPRPAATYVASAASVAPAPAPAPAQTTYADPKKQDRMNKLNALLISGILTQEEYEAEKVKLGL